MVEAGKMLAMQNRLVQAYRHLVEGLHLLTQVK